MCTSRTLSEPSTFRENRPPAVSPLRHAKEPRNAKTKAVPPTTHHDEQSAERVMARAFCNAAAPRPQDSRGTASRVTRQFAEHSSYHPLPCPGGSVGEPRLSLVQQVCRRECVNVWQTERHQGS